MGSYINGVLVLNSVHLLEIIETLDTRVVCTNATSDSKVVLVSFGLSAVILRSCRNEDCVFIFHVDVSFGFVNHL